MAIRVFLTGSAGFVGSAVLDALLEEHPSWQYIASDVRPECEWRRNEANMKYVCVDVRNYEDVYRAIGDASPNVIIHSAGLIPQGFARYSQAGRNAVLETNVGGTSNMLKAAKAYGVTSFVFTGSCTAITDDLDHEYPNMTEDVPFPKKSLIYGESKARAEQLVIAANDEKLSTCVLRPSVIAGPGDYQLIPSIHACISKGESPYLIGTGDNLYDFTIVDNVAHAHVLAIRNLLSTRTAAGQAIFISNDSPITFRDFMLAVWAQFDHTPPFTVRIPTTIAGFMGYLAEWHIWITGSKTTLCRGSVKDAVGTRYANIDRAKHLLGYAPKVPLWDGVRISCDALKSRLAEEQVHKQVLQP